MLIELVDILKVKYIGLRILIVDFLGLLSLVLNSKVNIMGLGIFNIGNMRLIIFNMHMWMYCGKYFLIVNVRGLGTTYE